MKLLRSSAMCGASAFGMTGLIVATGLPLSTIGYAQTPAITPAAVITTFAGDGSATFNGDGGLAINSELGRVSDVAVDKAGNVYIADLENYRIRKVDTNGIISTVAGTGVAGFSGDGGPATAAQLRNSIGIAVDSLGNLYISDGGNARIRKVDGNSGVISTIAGTGSSGFSGDGGPATSAKISGPQYIALDSAGNIFFSDANNYVVRKIGTDGTINTIAGIGGRATEIGDNIPATQATLNYTYMV